MIVDHVVDRRSAHCCPVIVYCMLPVLVVTLTAACLNKSSIGIHTVGQLFCHFDFYPNARRIDEP